MQSQLMEYPTIQGPIKGTCVHRSQLAAKFQIWARLAGVTDKQSLAYLVCDKPESWPIYFKDEIVMLRDAAECERRISRVELPKDFGTAVPSGEMCFSVVELR